MGIFRKSVSFFYKSGILNAATVCLNIFVLVKMPKQTNKQYRDSI